MAYDNTIQQTLHEYQTLSIINVTKQSPSVNSLIQQSTHVPRKY